MAKCNIALEKYKLAVEDIDAGLKVGLKTIFLDENYKEPKPINYHFKIKNLTSVKKIILE